MIKLILGLAIVMGSIQAMAEDSFAYCLGYQGTNVEVFYESQGVMSIVLYRDGEDTVESVDILNVQKGKTKKIASIDYEAIIREAVKASNSQDNTTSGKEILLIEASSEKMNVIVNLNGRNGDSFIVVNGYVEPLTCKLDQ